MKFKTVMGVALIAVSLQACGQKATGQTVAIVNDEEITAGELNAELAQANLPATVDKTEVRARILQTLINRRLMAQKAREQGVDKSPEFLTKQRQMTEQLLIGLSAERGAGTRQLPTDAEISSFMAENAGMFGQRQTLVLEQVQFAQPGGPAALAPLRNAKSLEQVVALLNERKIDFRRGQSRVDSATLPTNVLSQINALPAGEPFVVNMNGQMVASVITNRIASPIAAGDARKLAVEEIRKRSMSTQLETDLKALKAAAKIEYQDGFAPKGGTTKGSVPKAS